MRKNKDFSTQRINEKENNMAVAGRAAPNQSLDKEEGIWMITQV
jgi:hypothetical protein